MNILIIDYERELLEKLNSVLMSEHYTAETAGDGKEGLEKVWNAAHELKRSLTILMLGQEEGFIAQTHILLKWFYGKNLE